jgi:hypothetical protein
MPSSVKNKLISKMNINQLDDVDSMIDDFLFDDDNDYDEYFTAVSNETCSTISSSGSEYSEITSIIKYNIEYYDKSVFEYIPNENNEKKENTIYSNIFFYLSFLDLTKYFK